MLEEKSIISTNIVENDQEYWFLIHCGHRLLIIWAEPWTPMSPLQTQYFVYSYMEFTDALMTIVSVESTTFRFRISGAVSHSIEMLR